jgi:hypothetical protein
MHAPLMLMTFISILIAANDAFNAYDFISILIAANDAFIYYRYLSFEEI